MASALHVVSAGHGPRVVLVHGSATDHATWAIQLASHLKDSFMLVAYDRRSDAPDVAAHAADLAAVIDRPSVLLVGSSFGAVVVLELVRTRPELCAGAVLIEPPMAASDELAAAPAALLAELDRCAAEHGGPAAAEKFLRTVLGDEAFARIPRAFAERSKAKWPEIRSDSAALIAYRPRYGELASVELPILLLGGDRSAPYFRDTLLALRAALPRARLEVVPSAGHMLHAEAPRRFAELLVAFAGELRFIRTET
jgi:pimeloyl-ACP methyl ester carboxylesterase